jgi:hypothetical protein
MIQLAFYERVYMLKELESYVVDDIVRDDTKVIFVLESPHTQEVKNGYPVAGKSGVDMSLVLFGISEPFGKLVHEKKLNGLGVLNISNLPLQKSDYNNPHAKVLEFFEIIRQNPKPRKNPKSDINLVIEKMLGNFKSRLQKYKDKKVVLCGNFAQNAFDVVFSDDEFEGVLRVPHPSFNNWRKAKYQEKIEQLKRFIAC